jgi:hypothetical protein
MNAKERSKLLSQREIETLYEMTSRKAVRRCATESGRKTPSEQAAEIARIQSKFLLRTAITLRFPTFEVLKALLTLFKGREDVLRDFIRDFGVALDRGIKLPARDHNETFSRYAHLRLFWLDGFNILPARNKKAAAAVADWPPLNRWNGRAAWQLLKTREPGLDYRTHRQRVSRLHLYQVKPILVEKIKISPPDCIVTYTPEGMQWVRENHSLGTVKQNRKKLSHDNLTKRRFDSVNETPGAHLARSRNRRTRAA